MSRCADLGKSPSHRQISKSRACWDLQIRLRKVFLRFGEKNPHVARSGNTELCGKMINFFNLLSCNVGWLCNYMF